MLTTVRVLSGDTELLERLTRAPFAATVHSVYAHVVNLSCHDDGHLCTVATAGVDDAPATLVLDVAASTALGLKAGDPVTGRRQRLLLPGGRVVDLRGARGWTPSLPRLPMPAPSLAWLDSFLAAEGICGGAQADPARSGGWESAVSDRVWVHLAGLLRGIRADCPHTLSDHARQLIGLGPGLTPSGDDVLLGVTLVAAMPNSTLAPALAHLHAVIEAGAPQTTDVSRAALAHAVRGRTRRRVVDLLAAMAGAQRGPELDRHGRRVTAMGHTSGTDLLVGISAALTLDNELRGER